MAPASPSSALARASRDAYHVLDIAETTQQLAVNPETGLTAPEAQARQRRYGLNELEEKGGRSKWAIFRDQFTNIMLVMLMVVAVVSAVLDIRTQQFPKDAIAIFAIVLLNGILGYFQENQAEKALAALKQMSSPQVRVLRDGSQQEIDGKELVPGDVIYIEAGTQLAADGRLLEAVNLQVREAALTGEAIAVTKQADLVLPLDAALGDRLNLVFQGTEVIQGRGQVLVTATGMSTELGRIAELLQTVETEPTPLQQRMTQLGNVLVSGSMVLVALVVLGGGFVLGWDNLPNLLEVSLSMAVAVVPESLPAVITVTLALGMQRMVKRQALIRQLPAVETLGSVTTICSDKTGTLTQNKMVVKQVYCENQSLWISGDGYNPVGNFIQADTGSAPLSPEQLSPAIQWLLLAGLLCNDAVLQKEQGQWTILGDPTEGALLSLAGKAGLQKDYWIERLPRVLEIPFSSERKRMSIVCQTDSRLETDLAVDLPPYVAFTKGSPELVLDCCSQQQNGEPLPLTPTLRQQILQQNEHLARQGLRVLGLAFRPLASLGNLTATEQLEGISAEAAIEQDLVWLGLMAMMDPPRPEVRTAVEHCRAAGIRPVMITGDHQLTAQAIAQDLGILPAGPHDQDVLTGRDLDQLTTAELATRVDQVGVYARVSPEHKLRIVQALQQKGQIVAMTGDGVNDAPALKQSDIGIAMGITGTDVSKGAADMVLLDDNFSSIVSATEEGRIVYDNIRRFIKYVLGSNIGEVLTIAMTPLLGFAGVPLSPLQILWMNLVTDGLPALALALEQGEPDVMQRPPYHPRENIFARGLGLYMVRVGLVLGIVTIALMIWGYHYTHANPTAADPDSNRWKTMVFTTLCLAQMGHAWAVRSQTQFTFELNPFSNRFLLWAVLLTTALQLLLIYVEPLRNFFNTYWLSPIELLVCLGFSALVFVWLEAEKLVLRLKHRSP